MTGSFPTAARTGREISSTESQQRAHPILTLPPEEPRRPRSWRSGLHGVLDIGSTKITCLIGRGEANGSLRVLGWGWRRARGIRSGAIVDIREAESVIRATVGQAEEMASRHLDSVVVNLSCGYPMSRIIDAELAVGGQEVTENHVASLISEGRKRAFINGRDIIHALPIGFAVDGMPGIQDPLGHQCEHLVAKMHVLDMHASALRTLDTVLQRAELKLSALVASPLASGLAVLDRDERDLGVTVVEMGGGTTSLAVFCNDKLLHTAQLPIGGLHVTRDLARVLSTSIDTAERLKTMFGAAQPVSGDDYEILTVPMIGEGHRQVLKIPRAQVVSIIAPRIEETLEMVRHALDTAGLGRLADGRIVLTGAASLLNGLGPVAARIFGRQVRMGLPRNIIGLPENEAVSPGFSTASGLLAWAAGAERDFSTQNKSDEHSASVMKRLVGFIRKHI